MINKERIVPVKRTDLLTLIGTVMALIGTSYAVLKSSDVEGDFTVTGSGAAGNKLCDQPVKSLDFASGVTGGTVYFVPDYAYEGVKIAGVAAVPAEGSADVDANGADLYKAVLSSGSVTITAVSPIA